MLKIPDNFILGAATSAYQIEGAYNEDGKGMSIWDFFVRVPGKIRNSDTGDIACDHYNRFADDIKIMKSLNLQSYRFSVSWPRVIPSGTGAVNKEGLNFYITLVDALLEAGIEPCLTLYHWDLPQELQEKWGGWQSRKTIDAFTEYARIMFEALGGKVKMWATFNEAYVVANLGYGTGRFAPGIADPKADIEVSHHLNLAHARTVKLFREMEMEGKIGTVICMSPVVAMDNTKQCHENRRIVDGLWNRWYIEPAVLGKYPEDMLKFHEARGTLPLITAEDMKEIAQAKCDFIGLNYYFRFRIFDTPENEPFNWMKCNNVKPQPGAKYTKNNWEVYPEGLYMLLDRIRKDYGNIELYVMENGTAMFDENLEGEYVKDDDRLDYIRQHLIQCVRAVNDGINLRGYYYWSLLDNFEWAAGYDYRFGIVRVNYANQQRTVKKSGEWYAKTIKEGVIE